MITVGVVGGSGYTGAELLRILAGHPQVKLAVVTSRAAAGTAVAAVYPHLRGIVDTNFVEPTLENLRDCDLVFFATPHGTAMAMAGGLLAAGKKIIDLAGDFRLKDRTLFEQYYGMSHTAAQLLPQAVYGLPELNREAIRAASLVANPGCYATAVALGFLPLLANNLVDPSSLIADAKSGVSGAGRQAKEANLFAEVAEDFRAYSVASHRHWPEIVQTLAQTGVKPGLIFVPHLVPMIRGIHATLYARLKKRGHDLQALYEDYYRNEPFVDVMPASSHPATGSVRGANTCRLAVHVPQSGDTVIVLAVEDNLVKGAAGQAVQNMNIMFGLDETTGLEQAAVWP
ncbi:MAG TPA: N-acetyl-gamma-glutamyl-phosphate reductase [Gammaproteobacteria bacterium]